jgi:hypothetical protein
MRPEAACSVAIGIDRSAAGHKPKALVGDLLGFRALYRERLAT